MQTRLTRHGTRKRDWETDVSRVRTALAVWILLLPLAIPSTGAQPDALSSAVLRQIQALQEEKATRTPAQRKMDSQLIYAAKELRGQAIATGAPAVKANIKFAPDGRVLVDMDAEVTPELLREVARVGGEVVSRFAQFRAVRALLPAGQIETVAALGEVKTIRRADEGGANIGSVTSEGDAVHRAPAARSQFGADGTGVKVGVLSDNVSSTYLSNLQGSGDLGTVTILPGQAGSGYSEGSAMLEIIHDLAPGASLYFATAGGGVASMAQNILDLRTAGCDIIVDDFTFFAESPFQDGSISRAVNTVTADGALYFSSAGNGGNLTDGTSSTWEGDFADGGAAAPPVNGKGGRIHAFGGGANYNTITAVGNWTYVNLFWSDPLGASTNDYDLYLLDSGGANVLYSSTTTQSGTQDPYEYVTTQNVSNRIVIVKASGAARFLHVDNGRGRLAVPTTGSTRGHNAAGSGFCVAAVSALTAYPKPFAGGTANPVESFSSDGPRHMFFNPNGSEITPGNLLSGGGVVLGKPDLAAADGVKTATPGFSSFFGTSAAAPHAAAIAALVKSFKPSLTPGQVAAALTNSTLDIMAAGPDRDSGAGVAMAWPALAFVSLGAVFNRAVLNDGPGGNGNGMPDPGETILETVVLTNYPGRGAATNVAAILFCATPGISMLRSVSAYPSIASGSSAGNLVPFGYRLADTVPGGTSVDFTCVQFANGKSSTSTFAHVVGQLVLRPMVTNTYMSADTPKATLDLSTIYSTNWISAGGDNYIDDVNILVRLNHTYDSDLVIALQSPDLQEVILAANRGSGGDNYGAGLTNTVFDDEAAVAISAGTAPFLGTFRPESPLSAFDGGLLDGPWRLRVTDSVGGDTGNLLGWGMQVVSHRGDYVVTPFGNEIIGMSRSGASNVTVRWTAPTNDVQYLEMSTNLRSNNWTAVVTNLPPTQATNSATIPLGQGTRFYRVRSVW